LVVIEAPGFLRHQTHAEAFGGAAQSGGVGLVILGGADDQQRFLPFTDDQELRQRIGEHRPAGQRMQHVAQAVGAAQAVIRAAGIEQQAVRQRGAELAKARGGGVDHEQTQALGMLGLGGGEQGVRRINRGGRQAVALVEKGAGAVAVDDRQFGAALPGVGRFGNHIRQQRARIGPITQVADLHLQGLGGLAGGGHPGCASNRQQIDHGVRGELAHKALHDRKRQHRKP